MKIKMSMNLKILQKMMQDLVLIVQLKLHINSSINLITNLLSAYKWDYLLSLQFL